MAESGLPVFPKFPVHAEGAIGTRWRKWVQRLENLFVGMKITDNKRKRALLLHYAGEEVYDIFDTFADTGNDENYDQAKDALKNYFEPKVNKEYEREIKSQIIQSCTSSKLRRKALSEEMTLNKLLETARTLELAEKQASGIENYNSSVNKIHQKESGQRTHHWKPRRNPEPRTKGSSVNILDEVTFSKLHPKPKLSKSSTRIFAYGCKNDIKTFGYFTATIETKSKIAVGKFYVVEGNCGTLLGYQSAVDLGIIPVINRLSTDVNEICEEFADLFQGIGKIKDVKVKIHVDKSIKPTVQPHRRIPFHLRKKVEAELRRLEDLDIIEKVEGPTPWVSPIVVAPKPKNPDEIRMCVDMRLPNEAIQRTRHITPTVDDIIHDLNGAKIFSKLDMNAGYHQIELEEQSRYITTFTTHVGLRRYKRLNFGISLAAEIFQETVSESLQGLQGVKNMSDDIIVYGETQEQHDTRLRKVMERLRERNITLNRPKCEFNKQKLSFFGYVFSADGISADPAKIQAIKSAKSPTNTSEVKSFLGMTNYVSRFIQDYSTITQPIRILTQKNMAWKWETKQQLAFEKLKNSLTSDTVMSYYDQTKSTEVVVDASPVGLGAILSQEGKIVAYASRSLTHVEQRYSQTEREALAIVWSCEHFHLYIYGSRFTLVTDHKPLESIFNNPKSKPPARIERWRLRLQAYDFHVKYKKGVDNPADYMSRHPDIRTDENGSKEEKIGEEFVNFVAQHAVPKTVTLLEVAECTANDANLQMVIQNLRTGKWITKSDNMSMQSFYKLRNELCIGKHEEMEILLRGSRLVIPSSLQRKIVDIAHEGHQGIVKTKQLLREKIWFPGIDSMVENLCKSCIPCLSSVPANKIEPLRMSKLPNKPWLETDNGPPFRSHEFNEFTKYMGFTHRKITPLWPRANGEVERFMRTIGKVVKTSHAESRNWKQDIFQFLRNYRATPHSTTKVPPAEALFGRNIKVRLPENPKTTKFRKTEMRRRDENQKQKMKHYADKKNNAKHSSLRKGDRVIVQQKKRNKLSTPYEIEPLEVIGKKGSMITASNENKTVTRNSSAFKEIKPAEVIIDQSDNCDNGDVNNPETNTETTKTSDAIPMTPRYNLRQKTNRPTYLDDYVSK
nr:uncharacterized protein K02A2.6-like [Crassostrea gigas]